MRCGAQLPWGEEFTYPAARELFGSNLLVLTWIKGEPLPGDLVSDILGGLGLERETQEEFRRRSTAWAAAAAGNSERSSRRSAIERLREAESDDEDENQVDANEIGSP